MRRVFGDSAPPLLSPKTLMGEPMGAGGSLGAALAFKAWQHGGAGAPAGGLVLVNSGSLGGTHFSIALAPHSPKAGAA